MVEWCNDFERGLDRSCDRDRVCGLRILAISGSLQASSGNLTLIEAAMTLASGRSAPSNAVDRVDFVLGDHLRHLPLFNPDIEAEGRQTPSAVAVWRQALRECDAVLIASPEYGHSLPGALKNGIDWTIGTGEFHQKAVAITTSVGHADRGKLGLRALKGTLRAIDAIIVWEEPIVQDDDSERRLSELLSSLVKQVND
jgi:chromate reductase